MFLSKKCASVISDLIFSSIKKVCQKKKEERKVAKKRVEKSCEWRVERSVCYMHKFWNLSSSCTTRLLSIPWCKILLGFDCNTYILSILLVCIKSEFSLRVCLIHLHHLYLVVSTRHWTSSLDCNLALQYLEFRLHSLCIIPHQAPLKSHRNRNADLVFA